MGTAEQNKFRDRREKERQKERAKVEKEKESDEGDCFTVYTLQGHLSPTGLEPTMTLIFTHIFYLCSSGNLYARD